MLIGDSKAFGWHDTVVAAVDALDARLAARLFPGCPSIDVTIKLTGPFAGAQQREQCRENHDAMRALVLELRPDLVVLAEGSHSLGIGELLVDGSAPSPEDQQARWVEAFAAELRWFLAEGIPIVAIADNPAYEEDPLGTRDYLHYFDSNHLSTASMTAMLPDLVDLLATGLGR